MLAIPGIIVATYAACELLTPYHTHTGAGYSGAVDSDGWWAYTYAQYSYPTQDWIRTAYNASQNCGNATMVFSDWLAAPVRTTSMSRSAIAWHEDDKQYIYSKVAGDGGVAEAQWD